MSLLDEFAKTGTGRQFINRFAGTPIANFLPGVELGSFGDVVFTCSMSKFHTFRDYNRSTEARYGTHDIIGKPSQLEFTGLAPEQITLAMDFNAFLGVSPSEEADRLRDMCNRGEAARLLIGGQVIGRAMWVIKSISESNTDIDANGNIIRTSVAITLVEYNEGGA